MHFDQFSKTIEWNRLNCATVFRTNKIAPCSKPKGTNNAAPDSLFSIYGEAVLVVPAVMKQFYLFQYKTEKLFSELLFSPFTLSLIKDATFQSKINYFYLVYFDLSILKVLSK